MSNNKIAGAYDVSPAAGYAGDVAPSTAWKILSENKDAVLIDVRTRAEWNYVGLPELASVGKEPALLEWQVFPSRQANPVIFSFVFIWVHSLVGRAPSARGRGLIVLFPRRTLLRPRSSAQKCLISWPLSRAEPPRRTQDCQRSDLTAL